MLVEAVTAVIKIRGIRRNESFCDAFCRSVGLSSSKFRPSYGVSQYMQSAGYRIIPVNPNEREALGEKAYARLGNGARFTQNLFHFVV